MNQIPVFSAGINVSGGSIAGTLSTASQTNITGVGTISTGTWQGTAIASTYIAADAITGAKIADDAIDSEHYTDGSIDNAHIADDAIDSEHYADGSIDNAHIADDAIDSEHYAAGSIDTAHIADDQVTLAKMAGLTRGSLIIGDSGGNPSALAKGTANYILTSDGTDIDWAAAPDATNSSHVLVTDNESTDEENLVTFVEGATSSTGNVGLEMDGNLTYNPSSGTLTATAFAGALTGNVTGNASGTAATVTSGTQANITTLANLTTSGALGAGSISSGFGAIDNGTSGIRTDTFTAETSVLPDAVGGADLGSTSAEWGDIFIADDKAIKFGDGQDASIEYDEDGTDQMRFAGNSIFENQVELAKDLLIDSSPADTVYSGVTAKFTAGEDLEDGEVVYMKAGDSKVWKSVSNTGGTGLITEEIMCVAMCVADVSANAVGTFLLHGSLRADTNFPTYAIGETLYVPEAEYNNGSHTVNVPEGARPDSTGDFVQVVGWAIDANTVYFNPDYTIIEHA
jgi:hypothetical protein